LSPKISFAHEHGYAVKRALIARGAIGDFRAPDLLRFGFSPLYIRHIDVWGAVEILRDALATGAWLQDEFQKQAVT
jgi:kynureninase